MLKPFLSTSKDPVLLNNKKNISGSTVKKELAIDTTFDTPYLSSDHNFNETLIPTFPFLYDLFPIEHSLG
jgi:hypothetical protein